ncbi:MAG TPA: hypothetical protein VKY90_00665 [Candidatus Dormibacteraeota bacterium]|nr:hypothetical protein [Candidatus Dormibacteraeota bacterium]
MRLDPAEVPSLPLLAALVDQDGSTLASTPEWQGPAPGTISYHAGRARLLVGPGGRRWPEQEEVVGWLLEEIRTAVSVMPDEQALCARVLSGGLALVAGRPVSDDVSTTAEVLARARVVILARVPEVEVEVVPAPPEPVPGGDLIALALLQFATNAVAHGGDTRLRLRVGPGPTFFVEWAGSGPRPVVPGGQSHPALRRRWGLGYVRMVADYLGGTALPPGPTAPGWMGSCLSLGHRRLTLPLALYEGQRLVRCSQTWEQSVRGLDPQVLGTMLTDLTAVLRAAEHRPGMIVRDGVLVARRTMAGTWVALPPEMGPERVRDTLRGLAHERALWSAPEPHATRVHGLIAVLDQSLGGQPSAFAPEAFARELPRACAALGVPPPDPGPLLACPDPRTIAFLLAEVGGELVAEGSATFLLPPSGTSSPLLGLLRRDARGRIRLTPG